MTDTATAKTTVHLVIIFLGLFAMVGLAGILWLTDNGVAADKVAVVVALVGPASGALAGVLASTRSPVVPPVAPPLVEQGP